MKKIVSVIIPVYNVEKYIKKCLESICTQTYKEMEIIVVDDGSPDNSIQICKEMARSDSRITIIRKENGGLASARNAALNVANGYYVACVDSDDWIDPNMIEVLVNDIETYDSDLAVCDYYIEKNENCVRMKRSNDSVSCLDSNQAMKYALLPKYYYGFAWNKLYKRKLIGNLRYNEAFRKGEDSPFSCEYISNCKKIVYHKTPLYHYRMDSTSITRSEFELWKLSVLDSYNSIIEMLNKKGYPKEIVEIQEARYANQMLSLCSNIMVTDYKEYSHIYKNIVNKMKLYTKNYYSSSEIQFGHKIMYYLAINFRRIFGIMLKIRK